LLSRALTLGGLAFAAGTGAAADHSEIKKAQQKLQSEGLYNGKLDGIDGKATQAALKTFQKKDQLRQTGRLDEQTEAKLGLNEGSGSSTPPEVKWSSVSCQWSIHRPLPTDERGLVDGHAARARFPAPHASGRIRARPLSGSLRLRRCAGDSVTIASKVGRT
jgi:peptidoglycan hydrolase-like protein with peptidoglycan-binding domain